jgi:Ca-activated chloride channel family protein
MVTADGRTLPLRGASLTADAKAGVIRVTLEQRFSNPYAEPLGVSYQMPLPADAAVSGFQFRIGDQRVIGEVDTKKKARERFDEAVLEGRTAALLDQERSALFTQAVGNIPPHTEVVSELTLDQKLAFLPEGYWEWRFPTVVAPRYLSAEGRVPDAARVTVDVADPELPVKLSLQLSVRDRLPQGARPESPSHALHTVRGVQRFEVGFAAEAGASLDRDVVVRWRAGETDPGVELDTGRPRDGAVSGSAYGLLTLVPPSRDARMQSVPRDLIILLDTSGSMGGTPIAQSQRVAAALIDSLDENDLLELIEFSNTARRWRGGPVRATANNRKDAQAWVLALEAGGGTEMHTGVIEALAPLRQDAQRQVVLMTDGLIGFESEIVQAICERLPPGSRVHTVGIGSGVNRSLTSPAARAGRGIEVIIGLDEDAERAAQRVLARTAQPLVTRVEISGSAIEGVAPLRPVDLYAGAPALAAVKLKAHGGEIVVRGMTANGELLERIEVRPIERGEGSPAIATLYAREAVEDLEVELAAGGDARGIDHRITSLGLDFQISTRLTSWVAVSRSATVDPRAPKRHQNVPQELPYGMSAEGLGLRAPVSRIGATATAVLYQRSRSMGGATMGEPPPTAADAPRSLDSVVLGEPDSERENAEEAMGDGGDVAGTLDDLTRHAPTQVTTPGGRSEQKSKKIEDEPRPAMPSRPRAGKTVPPPATRGSPAKEPLRDTPSGPRRLKARLVLLKDGRLAVEITVDGNGLDWRPGSATVRTRDGSVAGAAVNSALTTAPGMMAPGMRLHLVLDVPVMSAAPESLSLVSGAQTLLLELDA